MPSVVIVTYNSEKTIPPCLEDLKKSGVDLQKVIIVDNASKDRTVEILKAEYPDTVLIANDHNAGFAKAVNQGLERATEDAILLLNPDMRLPERTVAEAERRVLADRSIGVLGVRLLDTSGAIVRGSVRRLPDVWSQLLLVLKIPHLLPFLMRRYHGHGLDLTKTMEVEQVRGSFFMTRRDVIDKIGPLDERYFIWFEEVDFCRRAKEAGYQIMHMGDLIATDLIGQSAKQKTSLWKQRIFTDSMVKYFDKWEPKWQSRLIKLARPLGLFACAVQDRIIKLR